MISASKPAINFRSRSMPMLTRALNRVLGLLQLGLFCLLQISSVQRLQSTCCHRLLLRNPRLLTSSRLPRLIPLPPLEGWVQGCWR
jgi:hypothetical protein